MGHAESYYKPSDEYLAEQYARIVPNLTISETAELKDRMQKHAMISDRKVGEIERKNVALQDRLEQAGVKLRLAEGHPGGRHPGEG